MSIMVFVNYVRKDKKLWEALETTLALRSANGKVELWNPHDSIISGQNRQEQVDIHLGKAQLFLLLLSADFFADADCLQQMEQAFTRRKQAKEPIYIVPILLRPCLWRRDGLEDLQILPRKEIPVTRWSDRDEVLVDIAQELQTIIGYIDKGEFNSNNAPTATTSVPQQSQQANTYNLQAGTINAGVVGDNHGTVTINHGGSSDAARSVGETRPVPVQTDEATDVGIVIALREEFAVLFAEIRSGAKAVRDPQSNEVYYRFERKSSVAGRPYRCIATLIGDMGPTPAALQTEKMIARWNPSTLVLPGLAASLSANARLGDIVVASQVDGYLENAKANPSANQQGYDITFSGEVYKTSSTILRQVQNFEFSAPDIFQAWQSGTEETQRKLLGSERLDLISKKLMHEQAQVIDGHIASGPIVGAAQSFTNWLKSRDRKYLALEMEAMGVMTAVYNQASIKRNDTLILRAISDYGNEDKTKFDNTNEGAIRRYAMHNAIQLLWSFLDAGLLPQSA